MGLASSSAVRRDESYGSLGGAFGGLGGGERKLKKKPVLVLDPEELAKAHHLFQIGAAEQLGEFDPMQRVHRPAAALFSPILGGTAYNDSFDSGDDDYVAPVQLAVELADDEEVADDDLPPIDLDAVLALTHAEQAAEDAFYAEEPVFEDVAEAEVVAFEPEAEAETEPESGPEIAEIAAPEAYSPADALARIIGRAAERPNLAPEREREPEPEAELAEVPPSFAPPEAEIAPALPEPEPEPELLELVTVTDEPFAAELEAEPFDLHPQDEFDGEAFVRPEAPLRMLPIMGEEGTRSALRARLVREDLTLAHPEPSAWRNLVNALRRWFRSF